MPDSFWGRVKKGRLVQVILVYLGAAWLILQVSYVLQDTAGLPAWVSPFTMLLLLVGLVVVLATAWVQSHPLMATRAAEDEMVPGSWELGVRELTDALRQGRMPHLTWARALLGGAFAFWLLFGFAGLYVIIQDRGRSLGPQPAFAERAGPGVAVVPFTTAGGELELLREGMVDLLSTNLDGLGGFRAIASRTVLARWREQAGANGEPDLPTVLAIARRTEASYAVVGNAVAVGPRVRLAATVYEVATGRDLGQAVAEGMPDQVLGLVDELSVQIVRRLLAGSATAVVGEHRAASLLTGSLPALRAFLEAEHLYRRSDFAGATRALEQAVAADSSFALALFRLAEVYGWIGGYFSETSNRYADAAVRHMDRLSQRDALLLRAYAGLKDNSPEGFVHAREAVQRYPDDPDAWYFLGDLYFHLGESLLAGPDETVRALDRAVALDPGFAPYYIHLLDIAISRGEEARAGALLADFERIAPGSRDLRRFRLRYDLVFGDDATRAATLAALDTLRPELLQGITLRDPRSIAAGEALARVNHRASGDPFPLMLILFMRGKFDEMMTVIGDPVFRPFVLLAARHGAPAAIRAAESWPDPNSTDPSPELNLVNAYYAAFIGDWAQFDAAREASRAAARDFLAAGDSVAAHVHTATVRLLDGYALLRYDDTEGAIETFLGLRRDLTGQGFVELDIWLRWMLGGLLAESDRPQEAIPYLESMRYRTTEAIFRLGQVYERVGEPDSARVAYAQFLTAWEEADDDLPMLHEARAALARLMGEAPT